MPPAAALRWRSAGGGREYPVRSADDNRCPSCPPRQPVRRDVWQVDDRCAGLSVNNLPPPEGAETITKGTYLQTMADVCASEMVHLLRMGQQAGPALPGRTVSRVIARPTWRCWS